jgi:Cdc6-like AAA superfamily ATPase
MSSMEVSSLKLNEKLILLGLARALKSSGSPYTSLRQIREHYNVVCEEYGFKPTEKFEENLQRLIDMGLVEMKSLTHIGLLNVSAEQLDRFLSGIIEQAGSQAHGALSVRRGKTLRGAWRGWKN